MEAKIIDDISDIPASTPLESLRVKYRTFSSMREPKEQKGRDLFSFRNGIQTEIGNIKESVWEEAVLRSARFNHEEGLLNAYIQYVKSEIPWLIRRPRVEQERYAEELYADSLHKNSLLGRL